MNMYISLSEAQATVDKILKAYVAPKFNDVDLMTLPAIDMVQVFGNRKRMDVEKLTKEICRIISDHIDKQQ